VGPPLKFVAMIQQRTLVFSLSFGPLFDAAGSLAIFSRLVVGVLFLLAAILKLTSRNDFAKLIGALGLLPSAWSPGVALGLPLVEIVVGCALVLGITPMLAGAVASLMLVVFTIALALSLSRGRSDLSCGCFGGRATIGWHMVLRNVAFLFVAVSVMSADLARVCWLAALSAGAASWWLMGSHWNRPTPREAQASPDGVGRPPR